MKTANVKKEWSGLIKNNMIEEFAKKHFLNLRSFSEYVEQNNITTLDDSVKVEYLKTVCGGVPLYAATGLPSYYSICERCGNSTEDKESLGRKCAAQPRVYSVHLKDSNDTVTNLVAINENQVSGKIYNYLNSRNLQKDFNKYEFKLTTKKPYELYAQY
jgi:hypothetical protein